MDFLSFELGTIVTFVTQKIIERLGPDQEKTEFRQRLIQRVRRSGQDAAAIQCIGMPRPIPITDIYQQTRFLASSSKEAPPSRLPLNKSAIIFAPPGMGKTTLLNWLYIELARSKTMLPLLFYLREPTAVEDLKYLVESLTTVETREEQRKLKHMLGENESEKLVLLVDGYDEIPEDRRQAVSDHLKLFASLECGIYVLTCRSFYHVHALKAQHYNLAPFSPKDSERFIDRFSSAYRTPVDARALLADLHARGFSDFTTHPLMLTLVCILKTGNMPSLPRNPISLIRRALEILTFRWDEEKGIHRSSSSTLDGDDRLRCIMRIAFFMEIDRGTEAEVESVVGDYLRLAQVDDITPRTLLKEIVQWFGIVYQDSESNWKFAHKTIHDYLAARFWVESAAFTPTQVRKWDARAGYAACLLPDATQSLSCALRFSTDISAFVEALANNPSFEVNQVAAVVREHFEKTPHKYSSRDSVISVSTTKDFFPLASDKFLVALVTAGAKWQSPSTDLLVAYGLSECLRRRNHITADLAQVLLRRFPAYPSENLEFQVHRSDGVHSFTLSDALSSVASE